jgi:hypothetical protein
MMNEARLVPLSNDPAREAVDSLRGYSYQMLRSIDAWLNLGEGQILFLEGAEDFDRIDQSGAVVEQVKDTTGSGNITLRSANAIAALGNFWSHLERNPSTAIQFRYLTTSGIGKERGDDIDLASSGIETWERIRQSPAAPKSLTDADVIRKFLARREDLPLSMRIWLGTATAEEFVSRVVEPFAWITDQLGADRLRGQIEAKLVELGESRGIGSADAMRALGSLHIEAWANVTDADRPPLRRGDLLRIFDAAGTTPIPTAQLLDLLRQLSGGSTSPPAIARTDRAMVAPPRALARRFARPGLEAAVAAGLDQGPVLIHGSTGMGKTGLAIAAVAARPGIGWVDLRDLSPTTVASRLDSVADIVAARATPCTVVLDDFDPGEDPRAMLPAIGRLIVALASLGGALLVTGAQRLPPRVALTFALTDDRTFEAPAFNDEEIAAYFRSAGCPEGAAATWSKIVYGSTSGHPQLVDARRGALQEADWPRPDISELIAPPAEIVDVRAEARRMVAALPEADREMLCRASLLIGRVSRQRLIAIGGIAPPITEPGHVIDRVTGPWLELTDTADLRMSPLLRSFGVDTRGQEWSRTMHGSIAWAWLTDRSLTASDVSTLLMHAVIAGRAGPIVQILPKLLQAPAEVWKQIREASGMFVLIGVGAGQASPFRSAVDTAAFRILQLRIAEELGSEKVQAVVAQALQEADAREANDVGAEFFDFLFMWQLMREGDSTRSIRGMVDLGARFVRLGERVRDRLLGMEREGAIKADNWPDLTKLLTLSFIPAVTDADKLEQLLDALQERTDAERGLILSGYAGDADRAALALDRVWLGEAQRQPQDWVRLAPLLYRTVDMAVERKVDALAVAATSLLIRVMDENIGDACAALEAADQLLARLGDAPRILAAKAKVMWRSGDPEASLPLYEDVLTRFDLPRPWLTTALREAGMAAARAERWPLCAARFGDAVAPASEEEPLARRVGLMFDHGLALHLSGETRRAVETFGVAVGELIDDGQALPPEPLLSTRQLGAHAIKVVRMGLDGEQNSEVADIGRFIGQCSALNALNWNGQRPASLDLIVQTLFELDLLVPGFPAVAIRLSDWLRHSKDVLAMSVAGQGFVRLALATGDVAPIMSDAVRQISYLTYAVAERAAGRDTFGSVTVDPPVPPLNSETRALIAFGVLSAVVALMALGRVAELPLQRWRDDLPVDPSYDEIRTMLNAAETLVLGEDDSWPRVVGSNDDWETHALAALGALRGRRTPDELITAQAVAAHYLAQPPLRGLVSFPLAEILTRAWLDLCDTPFRLVMPRLTVPAIRQSVTSTEPGWARIKALMLAALDAVSIGTGRGIRAYITALPA